MSSWAIPLREHDFWRQFVEYVVEDAEAEVAFLERLGLERYFDGDELTILRSPGRDVTIGIRRADDVHAAAPATSVGVQFFADDAMEVERHLRERGMEIHKPAAVSQGMCELQFHSPAGIVYRVWSMPPP